MPNPVLATVQRQRNDVVQHQVVQREEGQDAPQQDQQAPNQRAPRVRPDTRKKTEELSNDLRTALNNGTASGVALVRQWRNAGVEHTKILRAVGMQDWDTLVRQIYQDDPAWTRVAVMGLTSGSHKDACKFGMFAVKARFDLNAITGQWGGRALAMVWEALERVPPEHVSRLTNERLLEFAGVKKAIPGASSWSDDDDGKIEMQYQNTDRYLDTMKVGDVQGDTTFASMARASKRGLLGLAGKRNSRVNRQNLFSHTVLHEVGHAVDAQLNIMNGHMADPKFGAWRNHGTTWSGFALDAANEHTAAGGTIDPYYLRTVSRRVSEGASVQTAKDELTASGNYQNVQASLRELKANPVVKLGTTAKHGKLPWNNPPEAINGRVFQQSYSSEFTSYDAALRPGLEISKYQWRAPAEYFAEIYAAYYTQALSVSHPLYGWFRDEIHFKQNMDPLRLRNPTQYEQEQRNG